MTHYDNVRIKYAKSNRKNVSASSFLTGIVRVCIFLSENIHREESLVIAIAIV